MAVIRGERSPLAITADRADAFEERYVDSPVEGGDRGLASLKAAVDVPDAEYRLMLEDELTLQRAELVGPAEAWDVLFFDAHPEFFRKRDLQRLLASRPRAAGKIIILHELPSAAAFEAWTSEVIGTSLEVRVVSKLAPLSCLSQPQQ
jgi:hypothetical protein